MKRFARVTAPVMIAALLALCSLSTALPGGAQTVATIKVAMIPIEPAAPVYYAKENGFFAKAGLDVDIDQNPSTPAIASALIAGNYDIAYGTVPTLAQAHAKGLPFVLIAPGIADSRVHFGGAIMVAENSTIKTGKDFNGKTLGTAGLNTIAEYLPRAWIDKNGGDSRTVKFIEVGFSDINQAVESHRVDAASLFEPSITLALGTGKFKLLANTAAAVGPRWLNSVWFSTDNYVQQNPDVTRRFVSAIRQGAIWSNSHHDESNAILVKYLKLDPDLANRMTRDLQGTELTPALMQPNLDVMVRYNALPKTMTVDQLIWKPR